MHIPEILQNAIESLVQGFDLSKLRHGREEVSAAYREGGDSRGAFRDRAQLYSYLISRLPATFAVCVKVFQEIRAMLPEFRCRKLLDLGAGPGTASWAAFEVFEELEKLWLIEREAEAIEVGKKLSAGSYRGWESADWIRGCLEGEFLGPKVDLAVLSYVVGEMEWERALGVLKRVWDSGAGVVALIEPGTPRGYQRILALREVAIGWGAEVAAPCPHKMRCPMREGDWCHFPARVERTRLHRLVKGGSLGYEDEKYSYVVLARDGVAPIGGRVVRHPLKGSGHVKMNVCSVKGNLEDLTVTRSNKELYREARNVEWGSSWL